MAMAVLYFLVVVDKFNINGIVSIKPEYDAPVGPHGHGPKPLQVAFELVQAITRKIEGLRRCRGIENSQNFLNRIHQIRPYPAAVATFIEPFQAAMLEAPNH
jgi:hypothetical protein